MVLPVIFLIGCSALLIGPVSGVEIGEAAAGFSLADLEGASVHMDGLRGRNVLLVFGTTVCPACQAAQPLLEEIHDSFGEETLAVYFIAVGQSAEAVLEFVNERTPAYPVLLDEDAAVAGRYRIVVIPTSIFIDAEGMVRYVGRPNKNVVAALIAGESPPGPPALGQEPQAVDRLVGAAGQGSVGVRRVIVELDEATAYSSGLSPPAVQARRGQMAQAVKAIGGRVIHNYGRWKNRVVIEVPEGNADRISALPRFKSFKEDVRVHALLEDSALQIGADYAWANAITGLGVNVCVVDTGIDGTHADLQNKVVAQFDFTTNTPDATDDNAHGTHVAGIIASEGLQYRGVSFDVALMAAKVLDFQGSGFSSDVILGINWCVEQGADVINLSLGEGQFTGTCDFNDMAQAVNAAVDAGVVVTCASGNDGTPNAMVAPACASKVIAVGSVDKADFIASYSDGGSELDLVAPGGDSFGGTNFAEIVSTFSPEVANNPFLCFFFFLDQCFDDSLMVDGNRYIRAVGTSMAAPHAAGAAALLLDENPTLTPAQVKEVLEANADDLGDPGWDNVYGWGRINLERALDNIPPEVGELRVTITDPNVGGDFVVDQPFELGAQIDCFGGDGCGEVVVHAQFCPGADCGEDDFADVGAATGLASSDENPASLGNLSGITIDTEVGMVFDVQTTFDVSEGTTVKTPGPESSEVGSTLIAEFKTGDLEPEDGLGAVGGDAQKEYAYEIPAGIINKMMVRMENFIVLHNDSLSSWSVFTSSAQGESLHLIDSCIPAEGGGGEVPPPDCWFVSEDPAVLGDLVAGGTNYIKLVSSDVGPNDFLSFNDIEVIVQYEIDPANDLVHRYIMKLDLSGLDAEKELTAARLDLQIEQGGEGCVADVLLVDNSLTVGAAAEDLHTPADPNYSSLINPVKTFSCQETGPVSLNLKEAVDEALHAGQQSIAFQIRERADDQLFLIGASGGANSLALTVSQRGEEAGQGFSLAALAVMAAAESGPVPVVYDTMVVRDVSEEAFSKWDNPAAVTIGSSAPTEFNTGDLEVQDAVGAVEEDVYTVYEFELPPGTVKTIKVRMEHYLVLHSSSPFSGWNVYTSDPNAEEKHLIGDCIPSEGGGGEPEPSDCWWISDDPAVLADLNPGGVNYIKLISHDVGEFDWLTFNDIEVIAEYEIDLDNDEVNRYYMTFDISALAPDTKIDSALLNLFVSGPDADAVAQVNLVDNSYDAVTGAFTIFNADDADYSSLLNPIKIFAADAIGAKKNNVKAAVEDAVESGAATIAFLVTEQFEDKVFVLDGSGGAHPPELEIFLKSTISSGTAQWTVTPTDDGEFQLRVLATSSSGVAASSDALVFEVADPDRPVIHGVDCFINGSWQDCGQAGFGDQVQKIRIDASDPQQTPAVHLQLKNVPDDTLWVDDDLSFAGGFFTYETNLTIADSGQWKIIVEASDVEDNQDTHTESWNVLWGTLAGSMLSPVSDVSVAKGAGFAVSVQVNCLDGECPEVQASLNLNEPLELKFDDGSAEDFGDIGATDGFIAVELTPESYPAHLKAARIFIWDQTTFPFELHVWNEIAGEPGNDLMTPLIVDPVTPSVENVNWFDIDLSDQDITIASGNFYIGWRQIGANNNQVGFDTTGPEFARTWGYLGIWINLDDFCFIDPSVCGNIMIRAIMGDPDGFEGPLPGSAAAGPFYIADDHPFVCGEMGPGDVCEQTFQVLAVGPVAEEGQIQAVFQNNFSQDSTASVGVTIEAPLSDCMAANLDAILPVDMGDFSLLSGQWQQENGSAADIDGDGVVTVLDLAIMGSFWLSGCP